LLGPLTKGSDFFVREHIHCEITLGFPESVACLDELCRYSRVKRRLVKPFVGDNVAWLSGLPTPFRLVIDRVKQQSLAMPMWIYSPAHRT
jgi:hypothetical protein